MKKILSLLVFTLVLGACEEVETYDEVDNDFVHNFDAAWNLINENYCYLGYKNIDWDKIYDEYKPRVENAKDEYEFFDIMSRTSDKKAITKQTMVNIGTYFFINSRHFCIATPPILYKIIAHLFFYVNIFWGRLFIFSILLTFFRH